MAIDFPSSPAVGQIFNASPGLSFVYSSTGWKRARAKTALPKNYIVNPAMQISQQNGSTAGVVSGFYVADQWYIDFTGAGGGAYSGAQVASVTPNGSSNRARFSVTTANAALPASCHVGIRTYIEGNRTADLALGTASAKQFIIRFGFKAPAGTYGMSIGGPQYGFLGNIVITAGQANTDTVQTFIVPAQPSGAWNTDNTYGMQIQISLALTSPWNTGTLGWVGPSGNMFGTAAQTNGMASTSNVFELFDVGLYADPYQTGVAPVWEPPDYIAELRRCQRYWYRGLGFRGFIASATGCSRLGGMHPQPMRAIPTCAIVGAPKIYDGAVTPTITSLDTNFSNAFAFEYAVSCSAGGMTIGRPGIMYYIDDNQYIAINARM